VDYNAESEGASGASAISEKFSPIVYPKLRNLGAKHGIKAVRSLKAVLAPQSAAA
jgi:hypothetical protein